VIDSTANHRGGFGGLAGFRGLFGVVIAGCFLVGCSDLASERPSDWRLGASGADTLSGPDAELDAGRPDTMRDAERPPPTCELPIEFEPSDAGPCRPEAIPTLEKLQEAYLSGTQQQLPSTGFLPDRNSLPVANRPDIGESPKSARIVEVSATEAIVEIVESGERVPFAWAGPDLDKLLDQGDEVDVEFEVGGSEYLPGGKSSIETEELELHSYSSSGRLIDYDNSLDYDNSEAGTLGSFHDPSVRGAYERRCSAPGGPRAYDVHLYLNERYHRLQEGESLQFENYIFTLQRGWGWPVPDDEPNASDPDFLGVVRSDVTILEFKNSCRNITD
jgi:hypothetical protein